MDNSFIKLQPTVKKAFDLGDSPMSDRRFYESVVLHPEETYCQITNVENIIGGIDEGIVFNGHYKVEIFNTLGLFLQDITNRTAVYEFVNSVTGIPQISFEFVNLGVVYWTMPVVFKFTHLVSTKVFYSNPVLITEEIKDTVRIDYTHYDYFYGKDYLTVPFYESIRVKGYFDKSQDDSEISSYLQTTGRKIGQRPTIVLPNNFKSEFLNEHAFNAMAYALKSDEVYINGQRSTLPINVKINDRQPFSNIFTGAFTANIEKSEIYVPELQIFEKFAILSKAPTGIFTLATLTDDLTISFNRNATLGNGKLYLYNKATDFVIAEFDKSDFTEINAASYKITNFSNSIVANGEYYIKFDSDLFISVFNEPISITNKTDWEFSVQNGEFDATEFDNNEFLIV